jgi:hypothetical protein
MNDHEQLVKEIERLETLAGEWGENAKGWEAAYNKLKAETTAEIERLNTRHVANIKARDEARKQADEANAESAKLRKQLDDLRYHLQVPQGAVRLDAWKYKGQLIVCGDPVETDVDDPLAHNCDAMGCGSCSHIVIRERLNELGTLAVRDEVERLRTVGQVAAKGADGR